MTPVLLALNLGSSSLKFGVFEADGLPIVRGSQGPRGVQADVRLPGAAAEDFCGAPWPDAAPESDTFLRELVRRVRHLPNRQLLGVAHRIVHGGRDFDRAVRLDASVVERLRALVPLAPEHQPRALAAVQALQALAPDLAQVADFDTAFHRRMPWTSRWFALPRELTAAGVERYGFHGLSYAYVASELQRRRPTLAGGRVVVAHLGHGASLCALRNGVSVATTMGMGVADGLMMGRRCGSIDPGVVLHLQRARGLDVEAVDELLQKRSGLLGVSALSDDVRVLEASADAHAAEALELFAHRAALGIAEMAAALQGIDALVFTGGIGERSATMRARIAERCRWLGAELDAEANRAHDFALHAHASRVAVFALPTDEEAVLARAAFGVLEPAA
jgi:acetate kinase